MILKGLILSLAIIVFGLLTVTALTVTIIKRQNKSIRNIWLTVLSISLIVTISTSIYTAKKVINKTIESKKEAKNLMIDIAIKGLSVIWTDNREYLLDTVNKNRQIEILKSYVPDSLKDKVPTSFFTYFGFRDWYRLPIVYPYSINCADIIEYGQINDELNAVDITSFHGVDQLQVCGITNFTFDKNLLLAEQSDKFEPSKERGYVIFHFDTQKIEKFSSKIELMKRARQLGFTGQYNMMTLKEYSQLF